MGNMLGLDVSPASDTSRLAGSCLPAVYPDVWSITDIWGVLAIGQYS